MNNSPEDPISVTTPKMQLMKPGLGGRIVQGNHFFCPMIRKKDYRSCLPIQYFQAKKLYKNLIDKSLMHFSKLCQMKQY